MVPKQEAIEVVQEALAGDEAVIAAYLFGSLAQGKAHARSDVDVAILLVEELDDSERFQRILKIGAALEERLRCPADVVDLRRAPPLLRFRVIQTGQLVVEQDRRQRCLFQLHAMNRFYDARRYLQMQQAAAIRRIQEEGLRRGYRGDRDALAEARRLRQALTAASANTAG